MLKSSRIIICQIGRCVSAHVSLFQRMLGMCIKNRSLTTFSWEYCVLVYKHFIIKGNAFGKLSMYLYLKYIFELEVVYLVTF